MTTLKELEELESIAENCPSMENIQSVLNAKSEISENLIRAINMAEEALEHCKMNVDWPNRNIEQALSEFKKLKGE